MKLRGVPIEIVSHGQVTVELSDGVHATARDVGLELPGDGRVLGHMQVDLGADNAIAPWARGELEFGALDEHPRDLEVHGSVDLDGASTSRTLRVAGRLAPTHSRLEVHARGGGEATVTLDRNVEPGRDRVAIDADALPLALLEPLAELFGERLAGAMGERDGQLGSTRPGSAAASSSSSSRAHPRSLRGRRAVPAAASTAGCSRPRRSCSRSVHIDGELTREHDPDGSRSAARWCSVTRGVRSEVSGQLDPAGFSVRHRAAELALSDGVDASPGSPRCWRGPSFRHTRRPRRAAASTSRPSSSRASATSAADAEPLELEQFEAPGQLRFDLPYLERCTVERLGPGADVDGLRGPLSSPLRQPARGREKRRVLALGDVDYVRIEAVPELALAFVILEDARYWKHDGFDREQIERAFWFNLLEGRVQPGGQHDHAATARSLWLGIDRFGRAQARPKRCSPPSSSAASTSAGSSRST